MSIISDNEFSAFEQVISLQQESIRILWILCRLSQRRLHTPSIILMKTSYRRSPQLPRYLRMGCLTVKSSRTPIESITPAIGH